MPIQIRVLGNYHDIGAFATDVSKLSRIVTLNNLVLEPKTKKLKGGGSGGEVLALEAVAKTYRYLDSSELLKKQPKKGRK